MQKLMEL